MVLNNEGKNKKHPLPKLYSLKQRVSYTLQRRLSSIKHTGEARQGNKLEYKWVHIRYRTKTS
jgi:hypothetical protein